MKYLYTSDQHFGHTNIIRYCSRPFSSTEQMDLEMWAKLIAAEQSGARIIHLGDVSFNFAQHVAKYGPLWSDPKDHILIFGNHDDAQGPTKRAPYEQHFGILVGIPNAWRNNAFEIVDMLDGFPTRVILSHKPLEGYEIPNNAVNVHGHIHNNSVRPFLNQFNASVERHDYMPVDLDRLAAVQRRLYETQPL